MRIHSEVNRTFSLYNYLLSPEAQRNRFSIDHFHFDQIIERVLLILFNSLVFLRSRIENATKKNSS